MIGQRTLSLLFICITFCSLVLDLDFFFFFALVVNSIFLGGSVSQFIS